MRELSAKVRNKRAVGLLVAGALAWVGVGCVTPPEPVARDDHGSPGAFGALGDVPSPRPVFRPAASVASSVEPKPLSSDAPAAISTPRPASTSSVTSTASRGGHEPRVEAASFDVAESLPPPSAIRSSTIEENDPETISSLHLKHAIRLQKLLDRLDSGATLGEFERIQKAELEKKLIALFFVSERRNHEEYRDLLQSFKVARDDAESSVVSLELLKAAFYQELGLASQREKIVDRVQKSGRPGTRFRIRSWNISHFITTRPTATQVSQPVFPAGEQVRIVGTLEGFENAVISAFGGLTKKHRRSFSASLALYDLKGNLVRRSPLLLPGKAVELTVEPESDVEFWGRYELPRDLAPGPYMLELVALDLEGKNLASAHREILIR